MKVKFNITILILVVLLVSLLSLGYKFFYKSFQENKLLHKIINRLEAESRIAEVLVTKVEFDEVSRKTKTTIKFLEYDLKGTPLEPKYFTFFGNIIQFQSLVVRFDDINIRNADRFKGKSAHLFWKIFMLDGRFTQEYEITKAYKIPDGYRIEGDNITFQEKLWENFWRLVIDENSRKQSGIKNAQIEAPGTMFIPGLLYTIRIEHDGGMRIDTKPLPAILKGETIPD